MPEHNVDKESLSTQLKHGDVDTIDTNARYLAYATRIRTALMASTRYLAYTSDVGEAFRPVVSPWAVRAAYGVSWGYLAFDVSYEAYKAAKEGKDNAAIGLMAVKRGVFQSLASMAFPMITIHSIVKFSAKHIFEKAKNPRLRMWGPTSMGLSVVPFLPFIFDHPIEHVVDRVFEPLEKKV